MRIFSFFFLFSFLLPGTFALEEKVPTIMHASNLRKILTLDIKIVTKKIKIQRSNLLRIVTQDFPTFKNVWSLKPTLDTTLSYKPYLQKYALSCEVAALSMVLDSLGSPRSEDELIAELPFYLGAYSGGIWGDPDREFVGSITGSQRLATGYGVYPEPLANIIKDEFHTEIFSSQATGDIGEKVARDKMSEYLSKVESGAKVVLWGDWCTTPENEDGILGGYKPSIIKLFPIAGKNECQRVTKDRIFRWKTPEGKDIVGISGEHAFVLLGYVGKRDSPSHIIVWDTDTGRHIYPTDEWMRKWSALDYRSLLIRDFE